MTRKLVIFDFDGTLVSAQAHFDQGLAEFSTARGLPYDIRKLSTGYVDHTRFDLGWGVALHEQKEILDDYHDYMKQQQMEHRRFVPDLFDHAREMLLELNEIHDLAIITMRDRDTTLMTLDHHGIADLFPGYRTSCCARDRNYKIKPAPDALHCLLRDLGRAENDAVMIGDTTSDIDMANAAGVKSIAVLWGAHPVERLQPSKPTRVIGDIRTLAATIKGIW